MAAKDFLDEIFQNGLLLGKEVPYRNFVFTKDDSGAYALLKYTDIGEEEIVIPSIFKRIGKGAFENNQTLKKVIFSRGLKEIDDCAFKGCKNLEKVQFANTIYRIGMEAFRYCTSLKTVEQNGSKALSIEDFAFADCSSLSRLVLNKVSEIRADAFSNTGLLVVNILGVIDDMDIATTTFEGTNTLMLLDLTGFKKRIPMNLFKGNKILKQVKFSGTLKEIGNFAFEGCEGIKKVIFVEGEQVGKRVVLVSGGNIGVSKADWYRYDEKTKKSTFLKMMQPARGKKW